MRAASLGGGLDELELPCIYLIRYSSKVVQQAAKLDVTIHSSEEVSIS